MKKQIFLFVFISVFHLVSFSQKDKFIGYIRQMNSFLFDQKNLEIEMKAIYYETSGKIRSEKILYKKLGENIWMKQGDNVTIINNKYYLYVDSGNKMMFIAYPRKKLLQSVDPLKMQYDSLNSQLKDVLHFTKNTEGNLEFLFSTTVPEVDRISTEINPSNGLFVSSSVVFNLDRMNHFPYKEIRYEYVRYDFKTVHPKETFFIAPYLTHTRSEFNQTQAFKDYQLFIIK